MSIKYGNDPKTKANTSIVNPIPVVGRVSAFKALKENTTIPTVSQPAIPKVLVTTVHNMPKASAPVLPRVSAPDIPTVYNSQPALQQEQLPQPQPPARPNKVYDTSLFRDDAISRLEFCYDSKRIVVNIDTGGDNVHLHLNTIRRILESRESSDYNIIIHTDYEKFSCLTSDPNIVTYWQILLSFRYNIPSPDTEGTVVFKLIISRFNCMICRVRICIPELLELCKALQPYEHRGIVYDVISGDAYNNRTYLCGVQCSDIITWYRASL